MDSAPSATRHRLTERTSLLVLQSLESGRPIRKDIEGLRAIAVLAVVLNHMQPSALPGGFIGVDIFFVISGYLIGLHLLQDIEAGQFSFLRFYGRRARRLLPALTLLLAAVWSLGWMILSGPEFADLGKHIVASALFANNILLQSESGYFDAPAATKPLMHLWSLGVEEQFYLVVPLLLWLNSAGGRGSIRWVLRLSILSLLLTMIYPVPSFYLLDTRFWELGVGVAIGYLSLYGSLSIQAGAVLGSAIYREIVSFAILLILGTVLAFSAEQNPWNNSTVLSSAGLTVVLGSAICVVLLARADRETTLWDRLSRVIQRHHGLMRNVASVSGNVVILASTMTVSSIGWPGPQTVFPVLGAGLVILAGPTTWANRIIGNRILVFIGGISYSLYLWHWPAILYWKLFGLDGTFTSEFVPVGCAVFLAWVTTECIEKPVRFGMLGDWQFRMPRLAIIATGLFLCGLVGASTVATTGYPLRFPPSLRAIANWSPPEAENDRRRDHCMFGRGSKTEIYPECTPPRRPGIPYVLLWGDSHAGHLHPGLSLLHTRFDVAQWTSAACPPVRQMLAGEDMSCARRRERALNNMRKVSPDIVLLSAAWEMYLAKGTPESIIVAAIADDIVWLKQNGVGHIVLFGPVPVWRTSNDIFLYMLRNRLHSIPERLGDVSNDVRHLDAALAARAAEEHVEYVSVVDRFCNLSGCLVVGDPSLPQPDLLYRDQDHLTPTGSRLLMEAAAPQIFGHQ